MQFSYLLLFLVTSTLDGGYWWWVGGISFSLITAYLQHKQWRNSGTLCTCATPSSDSIPLSEIIRQYLKHALGS